MSKRREVTHGAAVIRRVALCVLAIALLAGAAAMAQPAPEVPSVNAELGPCWADFRVTGDAGKPLYNAKVNVLIRYGFLSKRKLELEVGTNSDGKARIARLPQEVKKPLMFQITFDQKRKSLEHDPATNCHANFTVELK
jgi:hypothetical protein